MNISNMPRTFGMGSGIQGLDQVLANLNKEIAAIKERSMKGLILSAAYIRNQTEHTPPLTPVDYGNLRSSWFVVTATSMPVGTSIQQFKGPKANELMVDHANTLQEAQAMIKEKQTKEKSFIIIGYSANYGMWVHEMLGANFQRPGAGPKWFESAIKRSIPMILRIIRDNAQIKK